MCCAWQEFRDIPIPFGYSLERVIDDLVFLCFFVGNDFIPHMPALDIAEGGLDNMLAQYKLALPTLGGYVTEAGQVCGSLSFIPCSSALSLSAHAVFLVASYFSSFF